MWRGNGERPAQVGGRKERRTPERGGTQLPQVGIRIVGAPYAALLATGAIRSSIRESSHKKAELTVENCRKEETFKRADGRRLRVARQALGLKLGTNGKQIHMGLLIAETSQEILLGYDFLRRYVKSWEFKEGKVTFVGEHPGTAKEQKEVRAELTTPAQPKLSGEEQRKLTWTPADEREKPEEELKSRRGRDGQPIRIASADEAEQEVARAEEEPDKDNPQPERTLPKRKRKAERKQQR